ncbi:MAG: DUF2934 domain-containing protein [Nitrospiraceae bacterium]|nr:MAG: DUF2934 domain-containing protein [Nitrospiraceae bacterium]
MKGGASMNPQNMTGHAAYELYERRGKAEGHDLADLLEGIRTVPEPGSGGEESEQKKSSRYNHLNRLKI